MHEVGVDDSEGILLGVLSLQMPSQSDDDYNKQSVAAHVSGKRDEVPWFIPFEENLGSCGEEKGLLARMLLDFIKELWRHTDCVTDSPSDKVRSHDCRLLSLPSHVP